jgi:lysophospholipase L1-like esterase
MRHATLAGLLATIVILCPARANEPALRVVLVGDSTVASYAKPPKDRPDLTGWGQVLGEFFDRSVHVSNHARSGASSKSFLRAGLLQRALEEKPNYVLIQFGHNDSHKDDRGTDPDRDYQDFLKQYLREVRSGCQPHPCYPGRAADVQGRSRLHLAAALRRRDAQGRHRRKSPLDRPARHEPGLSEPAR